MTTFSAEPGTWLVFLDDTKEPIPVIGWSKESTFRAWPILPFDKHSMLSGEAIRLPGSGAVVDPVWQRTFASEDEWRFVYEEEQPYVCGKVPAVSGPSGKTPASLSTVAPRTAAAPANESFTGQLTFSKKMLKNRSFWHCPGDPAFVFEIAGGSVLPTGESAEKVTRDEFYVLRKDLPVVLVDPAAIATQEPAEADDGDDGEDLI